MVYHAGEFMELHQEFGIAGFSCLAVEKKNHLHVCHFFQKTMKDGGPKETRKSAIQEIVDYENQSLYFYNNNVSSYFEKETKLTVSTCNGKFLLQSFLKDLVF